MATTTLTISSKNYSSWSLRGWLLAKFSGLPFEEVVTPADDPAMRAEILLLSPSILVPCLRHEGYRSLGHAGDRRIPQRNEAGSRPVAVRSQSAGALPLDVR